MGRNGAGKSTLLDALVGPQPAARGQRDRRRRRRRHDSRPPTLFAASGWCRRTRPTCSYADTRRGRVRATPTATRASPPATTARPARAARARASTPDTHPRDLSEGQRLALALAVVLAARPPLLLLDEPTRGLDYAAKARLVEILRAAGRRRATRSCSPPTTSSWSPRSPPGSSCSPTARSSPTARPPRSSSPPRRSPRRSPRSWRRSRWLTVAEVEPRALARMSVLTPWHGRSAVRAAGAVALVGASRCVRRSASSRSAGRCSPTPGRADSPHSGRRAVAVRRCCCRCCSPSCSPRSPTAAWTPRPSRCSACWPRSAPRCARSAAAPPASSRCSS